MTDYNESKKREVKRCNGSKHNNNKPKQQQNPTKSPTAIYPYGFTNHNNNTI